MTINSKTTIILDLKEKFIASIPYIFLLFFVLAMPPYIFKGLQVNNFAGTVYRVTVFPIEAIFIFCLCLFLFRKIRRYLLIASVYFLFLLCPIIVTYCSITNVSVFTLFSAFSSLAIVLLMLTIGAYCCKNQIISRKSIYIISFSLLIFGVFLALYTYVFQYEEIIKSFSEIDGWNYDVTSIFYIKTCYGFCLLLSSLSSFVLFCFKNRRIYYFTPLFFFANMFISRSKTSLLIGIIFYIVFTVLFFLRIKNKERIIYSSIFGCLLILLIIALTTNLFPTIKRFVIYSIFDDGAVVLNERFFIISRYLSFVFNKPFRMIFGYGERIYKDALSFNVTDNAYLNIFATGGIIKLSLFVWLISYALKIYLNEKNSLGFLFVLLFIVSCFFEDDSFIGLNMFSIGVFLFSFVIPNYCRKQYLNSISQ